jgi:hypothetical protein
MKKDIETKNIIKCVIISILIIIGIFVPQINFISILIASFFIITSKDYEVIELLIFTVSFAPIFKLDPTSSSLFNIIIIVAVLKFLFNTHMKFRIIEILTLTSLAIYLILIGGMNSLRETVQLLMYFILILLLFKQNQKTDIYKLITFFSLGIIFTSVLGVFGDNIPGLNVFLSKSGIRLESGIRVNRFSGIQGNPNHYTMNISIALSVLFAIMLSNNANKFDYISMVLLSLFGFMSISKSFLLCYFIFLLIIIVYYMVRHPKRAIRLVISFSILLLIIYIFIDKSYISAYILRILRDYEKANMVDATSGRVTIWNSYINHILSDIKVLFLGEGLGANYFISRPSHNFFIECLYYLGLIGSLLYFICLKAITPRKSSRRKFINYFPIIALLIRSVAINLLFSERLFFYYIIIIVTLNTDFTMKRRTLNKLSIKGVGDIEDNTTWCN